MTRVSHLLRVRILISYKELHFGDLLVDLFHELYYEVDKFVFQHLLGVRVCDEEGDIIALIGRLGLRMAFLWYNFKGAHLDWFPPQNKEALRPLRQKSRELVHQDMLDLICLLDPNAHTHAVDRWLNEDLLVLVAGDCEWIEQHFWGRCGFDLGNIMSLGGLGGEICKGERSSQGRPNAL